MVVLSKLKIKIIYFKENEKKMFKKKNKEEKDKVGSVYTSFLLNIVYLFVHIYMSIILKHLKEKLISLYTFNIYY